MAIPTVRMVLIHTGKILKGTYQQFTTDELKKMEKAAGFILNPCTEYGVYGDNYESHYLESRVIFTSYFFLLSQPEK